MPEQLLPTAAPGTALTAATDYTPVVRSLPFTDSFENVDHWRPDGIWSFTPDEGYDEGHGWWVDASPRATTSTLTYRDRIDLSGALGAQLVYRQKGEMSLSDLISLDVSLDGGRTWFPIDQQIGLSTEWETHIVDLTKYRGLVIQIRFRINTGTVVDYDPASPPGYWIDDLSIQYALSQPDWVYNSGNLGPHTLMGLHLVVGARKEPIIDLVTRLKAIGWPLGSIKGTSSTEDILNEVAAISPETTIIYRSLLTPLGMRDCPDTAHDAVTEAANWMAGVRPYWDSVNADYYELVNECWPPLDWLIAFTIESMRLATEQGQCLLVFSFGVGNPEPYEYVQLRPVYEYAIQNPCRPGYYHGIALHAYGLDPDTLLSESGIYLGYRHRLYYTLMVPELPDMLRIPVYLTEAGTGDGMKVLGCDEVTRDIVQYTRQLELDPYVRGFHVWNFGLGGHWVDYTNCLPMITDALTGYYSQKSYSGPAD